VIIKIGFSSTMKKIFFGSLILPLMETISRNKAAFVLQQIAGHGLKYHLIISKC
jgi:hypothetical protein